MPAPRSPHRSVWPRLAGLWFVVSTALLVWPIYPWLGNRVYPRVLGLPWSLVYVLVVVAANFAVLLLLHHLRLIDDREPDEPDEPDDAASAPAPAASPPSGASR